MTPIAITRIAASAAVLLVSLGAFGVKPAEAQMGGPRLTPKDVTHVESAGEVTLTLSSWWEDRPSRIRYHTVNGEAEAPSDFRAVQGEVVFTEPGSRKITIPIVDDHSPEELESFTVVAWEEPPVDPFLWKTTATVWIADDDGDDTSDPAPAASTRTTTTKGNASRPAASGSPAAGDPLPTDGVASLADPASPAVDPEFELAIDETAPAGEFAVSDAATAESSPGPRTEGGASTTAWILGLAAALLSIGAMAWSQRRSRSSPLRP